MKKRKHPPSKLSTFTDFDQWTGTDEEECAAFMAGIILIFKEFEWCLNHQSGASLGKIHPIFQTFSKSKEIVVIKYAQSGLLNSSFIHNAAPAHCIPLMKSR